MRKVQAHAREIRSIKEHIGQTRQSFTEPEQLLSIQPLIASWKENVDQITAIDKTIRHDLHLEKQFNDQTGRLVLWLTLN